MILKSLIDKKDSTGFLNGACYSLIDTSIVFDIGRSFARNEDFYSQIVKKKSENNPKYDMFSNIVNLFISHIHEDHYAGLFNIPRDIKINLYIGKVSFDILQYKASELSIELPTFNSINFLSSENIYNIEHWDITPVSIPHNIVDTWGFIIKRNNAVNKFIYAPDISEDFWKYFSLIDNDSILIESLPILPKFMYKNDLDEVTKENLESFDKVIFVDYGWDFDRINYFLDNYFLSKKVFLSYEIFKNSQIIRFNHQRELKDANIGNILDEKYEKKDVIFICTMSEFLEMVVKYPNQNLNIISNLFELSINHKEILANTKFNFFNFFKSGHLIASQIEKFKNENSSINVYAHN